MAIRPIAGLVSVVAVVSSQALPWITVYHEHISAHSRRTSSWSAAPLWNTHPDHLGFGPTLTGAPGAAWWTTMALAAVAILATVAVVLFIPQHRHSNLLARLAPLLSMASITAWMFTFSALECPDTTAAAIQVCHATMGPGLAVLLAGTAILALAYGAPPAPTQNPRPASTLTGLPPLPPPTHPEG